MERENQTPPSNVNAFDKKVIYVYKHLDVKSHEGWLKVGETKASRITGDGKNMRIQEQNTAANVAYEVLYTTDAVTNSGYIFSDHDIHQLLEGMDIEREETINPDTNKKSEWFKTDLETVVNAIEEYKLEAFKDQTGTIVNFTLRKEQQEAVEKTKDYYYNCQDDVNIEPAFLWNAKPRFGKTLTAYAFASEIRAKRVLIVTNRPAIADSWYTDFKKFDFKDQEQNDGKFRWIFTSSGSVKKRLGDPYDVFTHEDQLNNPNLRAKNTVHFISLQDIKGRVKDEESTEDFKKKNKWIFESNSDTGYGWDLVIIDESHEGVDTEKAFRVFDNMDSTFTLYLSGTPFKALASNRFNSTQIYNWSYTDEQRSKNEWPIVDGPNPYADLPKMNIYTYRLSRILETTAEEAHDEGSEYAFDLAEFFRVVTIDGEDSFAYKEKVKLFLENLHNPKYDYPFSNEKFRENIRHTFWLLPGVKACEQMKKMLLEDEYFKANYAPEDIIMAAGNGDEDRLTASALDEVRKRIGEPGSSKHPLETRTITLSCGQLTTGVTVPAWTAVLMLNNCKSPSLYMQSAFRAQNPYSIATSGGEVVTKDNCFVFDFAPDRILQTLAEIADSGVSNTPNLPHAEKVRILINFLPVIAEDDEGKMKYLDAEEVLTIPLKLVTEEVLNRGFMSNRLFENISGIFGCPQDIKDIIDRMNEADGKDVKKKDKTKVSNKPRVWLDKDNKIHINEDITIATTNGLLGDKKYVEIGSDDGKEVQSILDDAIIKAREAGYSGAAIKAVQSAVKKKLPKLVTKIPDPAPKPGDPDYHDKEAPDEKPKKQEKTDEQIVRDRLRGFARTIPTFLMAYGNTDTTLENFSDNIPEDTFKELTNISKADFDKLRYGMDYEDTDENGNKVTKHFDRLINENVFNSSVKAFCEKRKDLAFYFHSDSEEDIFEYIPPQSNNQIFTPKRVVHMMIDMLEKENPGIFNSTTNTFIDLYMKSGMYITEIVRRIFQNTRDEYQSDTACVKHILENQVYGFAPTGILDAITKNYIFGFDPEGLIDTSNFRLYDSTQAAKDGTLKHEINRMFNTQGGDMKFTAVVGNPPYNTTSGGQKMHIWHHFVNAANDMNPDFVEMIHPSGWIKGGIRLNATRQRWIDDKNLSKVTLLEYEAFPGVGLGQTTITFFDNIHKPIDKPKLEVYDESRIQKINAYLDLDRNTFYETDESKQIERIVERFRPAQSIDSLADIVSAKRNLGVEGKHFKASNHAQFKKESEGIFNTKILVNEKLLDDTEKRDFYYIDARDPYWEVRWDDVNYYKVAFPATGNRQSVKNYLLDKGVLTTDKYIMVLFENKEEAVNYQKYLSTKFYAFAMKPLLVDQNALRKTHRNVPKQDFTCKSDIDWRKSISEINQQLYDKYSITKEEAAFIDGVLTQ